MFYRSIIGVFVLAQLLFAVPAVADTTGDDAIKEAIVAESNQLYLNGVGNCPCPYHAMKNGRQCGGVSAWSRPGGLEPFCYKADVTQTDIEKYRRDDKLALYRGRALK